MDGQRARPLMRGVAALALTMSLAVAGACGASTTEEKASAAKDHSPGRPARAASSTAAGSGSRGGMPQGIRHDTTWGGRGGNRGRNRLTPYAALVPAGYHVAHHPPNRSAERAFALAASSSLSLGGAVVSSEASKRSEILAMSSTAE
jgi:hypothetical protein